MTTDAPGTWTDLRALPADRWRAMTLPGSSPDVDLARLHVDAASGASLSLVRFPAGWERPAEGCYPVGEELVVLEGSLELSGVRLDAGDYGWVPPRVVRTGTRSAEGALVLAMFTGPPAWLTDPAERRPGSVLRLPVARGPLRPHGTGVEGWSVVVDDVTDVADADRDLLDLAARRWAFVPAGSPAPARPSDDGDDAPLFVRTWTGEHP